MKQMASKKAVKSGLNEVDLRDEGGDPFATDFFAQTNYEIDRDSGEIEEVENVEDDLVLVERRLWSANLPQITIAEVNRNLSFAQLPADLSDTACKILTTNLAQTILHNTTGARCEVISTVESDYFDESVKIRQEQAVCLSFVVEPQQQPAALILDAAFAVKIVETALSSGVVTSERRLLSKTELSVIEFLSLNCLNDLNAFFSEPLLRWQAIKQSETDFVVNRGLISNIRIQFGKIIGVVQLLLPFDFLECLSQTGNPLLARQNKSENLVQLSQVVSGLLFHVVLGETTIDAAELAVLESGDIILIERPMVRQSNYNLSGTTQIRVGDEFYESLYGDLSTDNGLQFKLREVNQRNANEPVRSMMPENQTDNQTLDPQGNQPADSSFNEAGSEEFNNGALALEKVTVKISVELASRRINLNELANIHIGQVIELGSRPTDPVELVADGRTVAIGELIDIEGNLGVRLTRVLL